MLICPECRVKEKGVYYCETHENLKGAYYFFIDDFSPDELRVQLSKLSEVMLVLFALLSDAQHIHASSFAVAHWAVSAEN